MNALQRLRSQSYQGLRNETEDYKGGGQWRICPGVMVSAYNFGIVGEEIM